MAAAARRSDASDAVVAGGPPPQRPLADCGPTSELAGCRRRSGPRFLGPLGGSLSSLSRLGLGLGTRRLGLVPEGSALGVGLALLLPALTLEAAPPARLGCALAHPDPPSGPRRSASPTGRDETGRPDRERGDYLTATMSISWMFGSSANRSGPTRPRAAGILPLG